MEIEESRSCNEDCREETDDESDVDAIIYLTSALAEQLSLVERRHC